MKYLKHHFNFLLLLFLPIIALGCSVKFIADYDEATDKLVTELQRKMEYFFLDLEYKFGTPDAEYENYIEFYKEIKTDLKLLELRASALPQNEITIKQVKLVQKNLLLFEEIHIEGLDDMIFIEEPRKDFTIAFINILKLELAKKRGA
jgi:hypothetical protein